MNFYHYFGTVGRIAIGYNYDLKTEQLTFAFAFCSPNDRFLKSTAREILDSRLANLAVNEHFQMYVPSDKGRCPKRTDLLAIIFAEYSKLITLKCYRDMRRQHGIPGWISDDLRCRNHFDVIDLIRS